MSRLIVRCAGCSHVTVRPVTADAPADSRAADNAALADHFAATSWGCSTALPYTPPSPTTTFLTPKKPGDE